MGSLFILFPFFYCYLSQIKSGKDVVKLTSSFLPELIILYCNTLSFNTPSHTSYRSLQRLIYNIQVSFSASCYLEWGLS